MKISIVKKYIIKILQEKHERLLNESFVFFEINREKSYSRIQDAEKVAKRIQKIKKYALNY
ncbi:hypothetical protein [Wenyingzhuangia sp. 2_MG-2023]|uniref:hypothetical protein n=1 Tax=Wenyingzhuangia sp. 2_MG-2023 TaxID=3062639 RepID=UPI0026E3B6EA|nr:hypothetical protein [Wenyingzhuangia sp. 2_MG-2023]MDO6737202.1 hypothetical protein [Wenyingzhuangia sp. 2_MG-2023]MDO6801720.1 hypothetical protein [Wenyingzhuangia sp. 1_MG-2023]